MSPDAHLNTIVIPSKDRQHLLLAYLIYLDANRIPYHVLVLESGAEYPQLDRLFPNLRVTHLRYDADIPFFDKILDGLGKVSTPFVTMCTDDDITTATGMRDSVNFLEANPDYSACQGYHVHYSIVDSAFNLVRVLWFTPGLDQADPLQRLNVLMSRYQPICWATFRREILVRIIADVAAATGVLFRELTWSSHAVLAGKVHRLSSVYCWRRIDDIQLLGHPLYALIEDPAQFNGHLSIYRNILVERLRTLGHADTPALDRTIDLIHWRYFVRELDPGVIGYLTEQRLVRPEASIADADIRAAIKPVDPDTSAGWQGEAVREDRVYRVFPAMLDPQPSAEIDLPHATLEGLLEDLDRYPLS